MPKFIVYRYSTDSIVVEADDEDEALAIAQDSEAGFCADETSWGVEEDS